MIPCLITRVRDVEEKNPLPASQSLKIRRSELEIVGTNLSSSQLPDIFISLEQAKLYKLMMMELVNGPDELFIKFMNHLLVPRAPASDRQSLLSGLNANNPEETSSPGNSAFEPKQFERRQQLDLLRNLVSLFFVQVGDDDWINSRKIQLLVKLSISHVV